jgi:hypothetical protein
MASAAVDDVQIATLRIGTPAPCIIVTVASSDASVNWDAFLLILKVYFMPCWTSASE